MKIYENCATKSKTSFMHFPMKTILGVSYRLYGVYAHVHFEPEDTVAVEMLAPWKVQADLAPYSR